MGMAAFSMSALCLSASSSMFKEFTAMSGAMGRENAAMEAMGIARAYFISDMRQRHGNGEKFSGLTPNPLPITEIPRSVFAPVAESYPGSSVAGTVIDLYYGGSFADKAKRLRIPHGRPSVITVGGEAGGAVKTYLARRYELRITVTFGDRPEREYTIKQGLLALFDAAGGAPETIALYMEK